MSCVGFIEADELFVPAVFAANELADRQAIEEFVGDDERRAGRARLRACARPIRATRHALALAASRRRRAGFDER